MLVHYKNTNVNVVYFSTGNTVSAKNVTLLGGVNKVAKDLVGEFSKHPDVVKMFKDGTLTRVETGDKNTKPEPMATPDLAKLNAKDALAIVAKTYNKDLLTEWLGTEGRVSVQNGIAKQLKTLELTDDEKKELGIN